MFNKVTSQVHFPSEEEAILRFWEEQGIFAKSLSHRAKAPEFVFYDGPPFATGLPHYGHLLASTIKDVVPRYQTMRGYRVDRVFGWDCHGLPVENEVERELGINSKREIEAYGVGKFNEACRSIVLRYSGEWEQIIKRLGRWVDFKHGYRTMDRDFMESIWWVFKALWDKQLIYEGQKIMAYCPRCATPLSNFEVSQAYVEVEDPAITLRFRLADTPGTSILAWTTTPWTLPANLALAVGAGIEYVEVQDGDERFILAAERLSAYYRKQQPTILRRLTGAELVGLRYMPLFPYFSELASQGAFRVVAADFVSTGDGTGVVHMAPGFGEDDAQAAQANGIPTVCPVDAECRYTAEVPDYQGRFVKDADTDIIRRLKDEGRLVHRTQYKHNYPHCWRCDAPLIYRGIATWFVRVERLREAMLKANAQIEWMPSHLKDGRFGKWLENARDWAISRNRYWGCPLPIWRNQDTGELLCFGSIAELEAKIGHPLPDIHKHLVDEIVLPGANGTVLKRVPEVLDCWFESGSMPYAQKHYPFENKEWVEAHFPADFIAEGLDQTRGWFYTLVVLGAALFDKPSFRHVVVNGLVLAEDGKKMSKRLKNYPDPSHLMQTYGADAMRLYMLGSPVVRAEDLRFSEAGVQETMRSVMLPLWHAYSFFVTYATVDQWQPPHGHDELPAEPANPLDRWILSRLEGMVADVTRSLDGYDLMAAATRFSQFIDLLTNWYIRRGRRRFWKSQNDTDKAEAYATLYHVLLTFCQTAAPIIPFMTETIYRNLRGAGMPESVHLCDYPKADERYRDPVLDRRMERAMTAVSLGRFLRRQATIRTRQPLPKAIVVSLDPQCRADFEAMRELIADELNVKTVELRADEESLVTLSAKANYKRLGARLGKAMKLAASAIETLPPAVLFALLRGESHTLTLADGQSLTLTQDDLELRRGERPGLTVANEGQVTVALDLTLDEALRQEGHAREVVHVIQGLRKEANLEVVQRIRVEYCVPPELTATMQNFGAYIASETQAVALVPVTSSLAASQPVGEFTAAFTLTPV